MFHETRFLRAALLCLVLLVFVCGYDAKGRKVYRDKPLGFYHALDLNQIDGVQKSTAHVSTLQPSNIALDNQEIIELEKTYNGQIVKWNLRVEELGGTESDVIPSCNIWLKVLPENGTPLPVPIAIRTHSVPTGLSSNVCHFWEGLKKGELITVIGELDFTKMARENPRTVWTELHIRPMVVESKDSLYIDDNLSKSVREQLLGTLQP